MEIHSFCTPSDVLDYKKISTVILVNLAIADILVIVVQGVPTVGVLFTDCWPFGSDLCHVLALVKYALFYMEVVLVMLLSVHRAYILSFPFRGLLITKTSGNVDM